jgi:hypothetical protein
MATPAELRQTMVDNCNWAIEPRCQFSYQEVRPIEFPPPRTGGKITTDCSGFVTIMAKWSGIPDPNHNGYDGQGFTGTLLDALPHIELAHSRRADLVVFGPPPGRHVICLLEGGSVDADPMCASHGEQGDPRSYKLSDLRAYFADEITVLELIPG